MLPRIHFWTEHCFDPNLQSILHEALLLWLGDSPIVFPQVPTLYQPLIARQASVGWDQLFFGRFVFFFLFRYVT